MANSWTKLDTVLNSPLLARMTGAGVGVDEFGSAASAAAAARTEEPETAVAHKPIIGVLGAKGGVGATTTAINLSLAFSQIFAGCTLVDANLQQPDVAASLDLNLTYTMLDVVGRLTAPDADVLRTCTTSLDVTIPNCRLLSPPRNGDAYLHTDLTRVCESMLHLNRDCASWLIDLPRHLDKHLVTMMDACDHLLLVFEPTLMAVNSVQRWFGVFDELGYDRKKVSLVLNRSGGRIKSVEEQLGKAFANTQLFRIPNAYGLIEKCSAAGEPAITRHAREPYAQSIHTLAQTIARQYVEKSQEKR